MSEAGGGGSRGGRARARSAWPIVKGFAIATAAIIAVILTAMALATAFGDRGDEQEVAKGPAASWQEQLAAAREAAAAVEEGGVLRSVNARALTNRDAKENPTEQSVFEVDFSFVLTSGGTVNVTLLDSRPPRVLNIEKDETAADPPYTRQELSQLEARLAAVKLSPREAFRGTLAEGLRYAAGKAEVVRVFVSLNLAQEWEPRYGTPVGYYVEYITAGEGLALLLNPSSGEVVERRPLNAAAPALTATATATATATFTPEAQAAPQP